ncbi:MAG: hypothetical protein H0V91_05080 [Flavisolibacter sp.]|nr:hypothetical protein [Flavisolibacter sp.]
MRSFNIIFVLVIFTGSAVSAQDTTRRREVSVTSQFKPVLKEAAKVNFDASPPTADTSTPRLQYNIPNQNLALAYQPGSLRPLALGIDTIGRWDNWNYVKLGYGSLSTPYFETGISLGDGNAAGLNIFGRHISSKGKIEFQDYANTDVELNGFLKSGNQEWTGRFGVSEDRYNKFGFQPKSIVVPDDSLKVKLQNLSARVGLRNIDRTDLGISYTPQIKFDAFKDGIDNSEAQMYFDLPVRKTLGGTFEAEVRAEANIWRYTPRSQSAASNNWFAISPALLFKTENANIQAGIKPAWDNGEFRLFPNVTAEIKSSNNQVTLQAGWIGYIRSNTYRMLAETNPWLWAPQTTANSRIEEVYGGIKGSLTDHFNYNIKAGFGKVSNQPFFINDTGSGKSFAVIYEPTTNLVNVTGEIGYTVGEKFNLQAALRLNKFTDLDVADKAWGILPFEFTTTARLQVLKDLYVHGDLFTFDGGWYRTKEAGSGRTRGVDLGAGLEFAVYKNIKVWGQFNNLLNNEYERWKQYPVYGFNFVGGVVFSFAQTNK